MVGETQHRHLGLDFGTFERPSALRFKGSCDRKLKMHKVGFTLRMLSTYLDNKSSSRKGPFFNIRLQSLRL